MKKLNYIFIMIVLIITVSIVNAKEPSKISGKVFDEAKKPLELVNVILHNLKDSSMVKGTLTGKDGGFEISDIPRGEYYLNISYVGYKKYTVKKINITENQSEVKLGETQLEPTSYQMNETQVIGDRVQEEFKADKKVINVGQNLTATGGTALDVLQNQPSVRVDADGTVSLRGSSNFVLQINGRPSPLQGSDGLKQIPANSIDQIELITNPSAKYEAEGSAGIINIILKKQAESSFSGIINSGLGSRDKYNADGNFNYRLNGLSLTGGLDYRRNLFFNNQGINRRATLPNDEQITNTALNLQFGRDNYSGRAGIDYNLSDKTAFSINLSAGGVKVIGDVSTNISNSLQSTGSIYSHTSVLQEFKANFYNAGAYFSHQFTPKVTELNFDAYVTRLILPNTELNKSFKTDKYFNPIDNKPNMLNIDNDTKRWEARIKSNFKYNINPSSVFETGVQATIFLKTIDYKNFAFDYNTNSWVLNPNMSNTFDFNNNVYAAFATYSNELFGFSFQVGLRAEYTDRLLKQKSMGQDYKYEKLHFFPSFNMTKKITETQQMQFTFSRRINRPFDQALNPFPFYQDSYTISTGNPKLLPEFTNSFELNYQKYFTGYFISAQTYFRQTEDGMARTMENVDGKTLLSFTNFTKNTTYGAELSGSATITDWFKIDPSLNIYDYTMKGSVGNDTRSDHTFSWSLRVNSTLTVTPSTKIQLTGFYNAKNIIAQGEIKPFYTWTFAIRQELFDKSLILNLQAQNLFNPFQIDLSQGGTNWMSTVFVKNESPIFMLTLSYNFNNFKRSQRQTENVDVNVGTGL